MNIDQILRFLYPEAVQGWEVFDMGAGPYISTWNLEEAQPTEVAMLEISQSPEFAEWKAVASRARIDRKTGIAIRGAIHQEVPVDEQIGILRDQIVRMLSGDMKPSDKFARLQKIATANIASGKETKVSLEE